MVTMSDSKENFIDPESVSVDGTLEEERRRTGRYLAAGIVIFVVGLGLYHAVVYGSTKLSALLGAALIMFLYLLWLLYASQRKKKLTQRGETALQEELEEVIVRASQAPDTKIENRCNRPAISRSYSIA